MGIFGGWKIIINSFSVFFFLPKSMPFLIYVKFRALIQTLLWKVHIS